MESIKKTKLKDFTFISGDGFKMYETNFFSKSHPQSEDEGMVLGVTEVHVSESSEGGTTNDLFSGF